jgi:hypothetical protein
VYKQTPKEPGREWLSLLGSVPSNLKTVKFPEYSWGEFVGEETGAVK